MFNETTISVISIPSAAAMAEYTNQCRIEIEQREMEANSKILDEVLPLVFEEIKRRASLGYSCVGHEELYEYRKNKYGVNYKEFNLIFPILKRILTEAGYKVKETPYSHWSKTTTYKTGRVAQLTEGFISW